METETKFAAYIKSLDQDALSSYADEAGTTPHYLLHFIIAGRRGASKKMVLALVAASGGAVSQTDVVDHLYSADAA